MLKFSESSHWSEGGTLRFAGYSGAGCFQFLNLEAVGTLVLLHETN
jgi:hypothetical protein